MKKMLRAAAAILFLAPQVASAKDYCVMISTNNLVFKSFTVPAKGSCKSIVEVNPTLAGFVGSGGGCTTTDGKTLLFTLSDGFSSTIETIQGSITLASGTGTGRDCVALPAEATGCSSVSVSVQTCPKKPAPIIASIDSVDDSPASAK